ncbi:MAG: PTS sugar transporter subunit IIA [Candidatus Kapabacteria bacterium]|nr:PTS sugar transporter subunit IIA [Candidatus Kapabacteria bacterium]
MDLKITDILDRNAVLLDLDVAGKDEALQRLIDVLAATGKVRDVEQLKRVIFEREKLMSTGIGHGVALPHGKTNVVDTSIAAMATLRNPIDFDALDDNPVNIIIMLIGTEGNVGLHLRLLSRISRMIGNEAFRHSLANAKSVDDVLSLLANTEVDRA